jgi:hypothetical protein
MPELSFVRHERASRRGNGMRERLGKGFRINPIRTPEHANDPIRF